MKPHFTVCFLQPERIKHLNPTAISARCKHSQTAARTWGLQSLFTSSLRHCCSNQEIREKPNKGSTYYSYFSLDQWPPQTESNDARSMRELLSLMTVTLLRLSIILRHLHLQYVLKYFHFMPLYTSTPHFRGKH